jgi:hypothetical protein
MADVQPSKLIVWKICTLAHPKLSKLVFILTFFINLFKIH